MWASQVGDGGCGKSQLTHALARKFCRHYGCQHYPFAKALDPLGNATRGGRLGSSGAYVFSDVELESRLDKRLSEEDQKNLFTVFEPSQVPARYHTAGFVQNVPKLFSVNTGRMADTGSSAVNWRAWFDFQGVPALGALCENDETSLRKLGGQGTALARRCLVMKVHRHLVTSTTSEGYALQLQESVAAGAAREPEEHRLSW